MPTILSTSGNKAGAITTVITNSDVDLTLVSAVTLTRGNITMTGITVIDATTVLGIEPSTGLEVGINHDIILGVVA